MSDLFETRERTIPLRDQIAEVKREIIMREQVYQDQVNRGRLAPHEARKRIAIMEAVRDELIRLQAAEEALIIGRAS